MSTPVEKAPQSGEAPEGVMGGQEEATASTREHPLVPLKNTVIFPGARVTLNIGRERSILAIKDAQAGDKRFIASAQRQADVDSPGPKDVFEAGTLVELRQYEAQADNTIQVVVEGVTRVHIGEWVAHDPYLRVTYEPLEESGDTGAQGAALTRHAQALFDRFSHLSRRFNPDYIASVTQVHAVGRLADTLAGLVVADHAQQQDLLETLDPLARLEKVCVSLGNEI